MAIQFLQCVYMWLARLEKLNNATLLLFTEPVYLTECDCQDCFEHRIRMRKYDTIPVRRYVYLVPLVW